MPPPWQLAPTMLEGTIKVSRENYGPEFYPTVDSSFFMIEGTRQDVSDGAKMTKVVTVTTNFLVGLEVQSTQGNSQLVPRR